MCIVSLNPASIRRELMANTVWVGKPTRPAATMRAPAERRLVHSVDRQIATPMTITSSPWIRMTVTITGRTGEPKALSSLIAWSR